MARRVILDTGVLIAIERGRLDARAILGVARVHARLAAEAMPEGKQRSG